MRYMRICRFYVYLFYFQFYVHHCIHNFVSIKVNIMCKINLYNLVSRISYFHTLHSKCLLLEQMKLKIGKTFFYWNWCTNYEYAKFCVIWDCYFTVPYVFKYYLIIVNSEILIAVWKSSMTEVNSRFSLSSGLFFNK